ncbi:MAG: hypothetical protein G01um101430_751 [Parcubacteria group bacterium Gr01-1014_30]|nr:MAG: hypothetical protein G01um101430_751 [Parcubacteria group bacterium Gr01-1014_30]
MWYTNQVRQHPISPCARKETDGYKERSHLTPPLPASGGLKPNDTNLLKELFSVHFSESRLCVVAQKRVGGKANLLASPKL